MHTSSFTTLLPLLILIVQPTTAHAQDLQITTLSASQKAIQAHAFESFREQRYSAAYGRFAQLADAGHAPSAQLALVMYRNGTALFDADWFASLDQQRRWEVLVTRSPRGPIDRSEIVPGD